jgi:hypothetical protein
MMPINLAGVMAKTAGALLLSLFVGTAPGFAADYPQAQISNGQITAKMYLPDAKVGYYRSTRFDWSGAIYSLVYKGHEFYGEWWDRTDPKIVNWVFQGADIVSGPCSALGGPVNEFATPLGFREAQVGGTFIKIGVGVLRKTDQKYDRYAPYEVLDPGKWSIEKGRDSVGFTQELSDPATGYAYLYRKVVRLVEGKPEMVIEQSLKNTGKVAIKSEVYDHNFMVLDKQTPGPDFTFRVPFQIKANRPPDKERAEIRGNEIVYVRPVANGEEVFVPLAGFGESPKDHEIVIENRKVGAGVRVTGDRPLLRSMLWSIRTVLAVEPYVAIDIQPGGEFTWNDMFEYYTLPAGGK